MTKREESLPLLPAGWEWETDLDGCWCARGEGCSIYSASNPNGECVSMVPLQRELVGHKTSIVGLPVRVAVAVAQANGIPWQPSSDPLKDAATWRPGTGEHKSQEGGGGVTQATSFVVNGHRFELQEDGTWCCSNCGRAPRRGEPSMYEPECDPPSNASPEDEEA